MFNLATAYGKRPSEIFVFETEIGAWIFDETCLILGREIENALLEDRDPFIENGGRQDGYRKVPREWVKKKKIKEDGTW